MAPQSFNKLLAPGSASAARRRLDQPHDAFLNFELDIRPRHESRARSHILWDGDLSLRRDPHRARLS
jgi:hypothetical protein